MGKNEINLADNLINIINTARENALKKVNEELINMYWQVGEYLHKESQKSMFGDSYIDSIAKEIQEEFPGIKGFNRRGLYRMKQFYETYTTDYSNSDAYSSRNIAQIQEATSCACNSTGDCKNGYEDKSNTNNFQNDTFFHAIALLYQIQIFCSL